MGRVVEVRCADSRNNTTSYYLWNVGKLCWVEVLRFHGLSNTPPFDIKYTVL